MEPFDVPAGAVTLAGERRSGDGPPLVLLHAGVADRRSWRATAAHLDGPLIAYDRRGFGDTPPSPEPFTHVADLLAVLDAAGAQQAWLVGNSMGGALAIDTALSAPERVAGLVLIAPAVSGAPDPPDEDLDPATARLDALFGEAEGLGEYARLDAWLWLDGPAGPEGRVGGAARELALAMNRAILAHDVPEDAGASGMDAWTRLEDVAVPATVVVCELDVPFMNEQGERIAARIPGARLERMAEVAHLPGLENPDGLAALIQASTSGR